MMRPMTDLEALAELSGRCWQVKEQLGGEITPDEFGQLVGEVVEHWQHTGELLGREAIYQRLLAG
jgi:hypothetical protein